jgi:hypothetical protein
MRERPKSTIADMQNTDLKMSTTLQSILECCDKIHRKITDLEGSQLETGSTLVEVLERLDATISGLGYKRHDCG